MEENEDRTPETAADAPSAHEETAEEVLDATAPAAAGAGTEADDGFVMSGQDRKLAEANERYIRLLADFDNYRKRAQKDRAELATAANEDLVAELLPVLDNLERALAAARTKKGRQDNFESVLKGVELTLKMFSAVLGRYGVERISAHGTAFNPNLHEAIAQVATDDRSPDTVVEELVPGYTMNGRLIRASRVTVAKAMAREGAAPEKDPETGQQ